MPSTWIRSDKYQFYKSLVWLNHGIEPTISRTRDPCFTDPATAPSLLTTKTIITSYWLCTGLQCTWCNGYRTNVECNRCGFETYSSHSVSHCHHALRHWFFPSYMCCIMYYVNINIWFTCAFIGSVLYVTYAWWRRLRRFSQLARGGLCSILHGELHWTMAFLLIHISMFCKIAVI